ncbi:MULTISPECIES: hypothetical protein [Vibrio]|uniref:hypothetical protein n=1 Tax=Vibrio TaxID=662 RepID=UPI00226A9550|nr:hypothetical protein [Vibrio parahaemolyticus]MCX8796501.1 hypothetical protein [Vibrio parahaemolyticus]
MNKFLKTTIALAIGVISSSAFASECNYKVIRGLEFEAGNVSAELKFNNRMNNLPQDSYSYLYERYQETPLTESDVYGRDLKIDTTRFISKTDEDPNEPGKLRHYRVYSGVLDNCKSIEVVIPEFGNFASVFDKNNDDRDGVFPFRQMQSQLQLIHNSDLRTAEEHVGKAIYVLGRGADKTNTSVYGTNSSDTIRIPHNQPLKVEKIDYSLNTGYGLDESQFSFVVRLNDGERVNVPFDINRIVYKDPLKSPLVHKAHHSSIKTSEINYGMNKVEVFLSLGAPERVEYNYQFDRTEHSKSTRFNPYKLFDPSAKYDLSQPIGGTSTWYYEGRELVFNDKGVLEERLQNNFKLKNHKFGEKNAKNKVL